MDNRKLYGHMTNAVFLIFLIPLLSVFSDELSHTFLYLSQLACSISLFGSARFAGYLLTQEDKNERHSNQG